MDATRVFRLISLIPDRAVRAQSGCVFGPSEAAACRYPERISYLGKFLHWLGPLNPMTREDQQILGVRSSGGRPMVAGEEAGDELGEELVDDMEDLEEIEAGEAVQIPQPGTQIAPALPPSTVGG